MSGRPFATRRAALRRSSSWTGTDLHPEASSSPSVAGRSEGCDETMSTGLMDSSLGAANVPASSLVLARLWDNPALATRPRRLAWSPVRVE